MATRPIFPDSIRSESIEMDNSDGTTLLDLFSAGTSGSRVDKIAITSDDTAVVNLDLYHHNGTSAFQIGSISVAAGAGTDSTTPVYAVSFLNQTALPWLGDDLAFHLESGTKLQIAAQSAITAAKVVHVTVFGGDY